MSADPYGTCDQCQHHWSRHDVRVGDHLRCQCGCMWEQPKPPPPPQSPPTLRDHISEAIWAELERQAEEGFGPYVDRDNNYIDGEVDMTTIADVLIAKLGLRQEWTWAWPRTDDPDGETGHGFIVDSREEAAAEMDGRCHIVTRYVTEWKP